MKSIKSEPIKQKELLSKPIIELNEMLERQDKMLQNRQFISRLKDKGQKIIDFRRLIEKTIKEKQAMEQTESLLVKLNLGEKIILPQHPMFTSGLSRQFLNTVPQASDDIKPDNIVKKMLDDEFDIFSLAVSQTFDEKLSKERGDRFVPNRIYKPNKDDELRMIGQGDDEKSNQKEEIITRTEKENDKEDVILSDHQQQQQLLLKDADDQKDEKKLIQNRYKGTALEQIPDLHKFHQLSFEESLQLGKEQKFKDFELERQKFIKRLTWRDVTNFDSDSEVSDVESDQDKEDEG